MNRVLHLFFELLLIIYGMLDARDKGLNKTGSLISWSSLNAVGIFCLEVKPVESSKDISK